MNEKEAKGKPATLRLGVAQGGAIANPQPSRDAQLIEAGEGAAIADSRPPVSRAGESYTFCELLGDATPEDIRRLLDGLGKVNLIENHILATIDAFAKARRITVSLQTNSVYGQPPALNRLVIEIDNREETITTSRKGR